MPIQVEIIDNGINSELLVAIITAVSVLLTSVITQVVTYFLQVRKEDKANKREAYLELLILLKELQHHRTSINLGDKNYYLLIKNAKFLPKKYQDKLLCAFYKITDSGNTKTKFRGIDMSTFDLQKEMIELINYLYDNI